MYPYIIMEFRNLLCVFDAKKLNSLHVLEKNYHNLKSYFEKQILTFFM